MHLGLDEADYTYLCTDVDFIIHAAAAVNLAYPYSVSRVGWLIEDILQAPSTMSGDLRA